MRQSDDKEPFTVGPKKPPDAPRNPFIRKEPPWNIRLTLMLILPSLTVLLIFALWVCLRN